MDRRKAMGLIAAAAAGIAIIPSCKPGATTSYQYLKIHYSQVEMLEKLAFKILPIPDDMTLELISPTDFLLTMMDDCQSPEEQEKFMIGLGLFEEYLKQEGISSVDDIQVTTLKRLMELPEGNEGKDTIADFLSVVKSHLVQYYTSLEAYLTTYTNWEFAPGRFNGCVSV